MWKPEDQRKLKELAQEILKKPICKQADFNRRFYLKTDWSKDCMGAALLQADSDSEVALKAELDKINGGPCLFDRNLNPSDL